MSHVATHLVLHFFSDPQVPLLTQVGPGTHRGGGWGGWPQTHPSTHPGGGGASEFKKGRAPVCPKGADSGDLHPGRQWYRHLIFSPGLQTGYAPVMVSEFLSPDPTPLGSSQPATFSQPAAPS